MGENERLPHLGGRETRKASGEILRGKPVEKRRAYRPEDGDAE
jgi:hypothetical protein